MCLLSEHSPSLPVNRFQKFQITQPSERFHPMGFDRKSSLECHPASLAPTSQHPVSHQPVLLAVLRV